MNIDRAKKVTELKGILISLECDMVLLEQDLEQAETHLAYFQAKLSDLEYNIDLHKTTKVITSIDEYKKCLLELAIVKSKVKELSVMRNKFNIRLKDMYKKYDIYFDEYERENSILQNENVILLFKGKNE